MLATMMSFDQHRITPWWFEGNMITARREWESRECRSSVNIQQFADIESNRSQIISAYGSHIVTTLKSDATRMGCEEIADRLRIPAFPQQY